MQRVSALLGKEQPKPDTCVAMASNLIAMASTLVAIAYTLALFFLVSLAIISIISCVPLLSPSIDVNHEDNVRSLGSLNATRTVFGRRSRNSRGSRSSGHSGLRSASGSIRTLHRTIPL